jgi:hypothetical protein
MSISPEAEKRVQQLASNAAKSDSWMRPIVEEGDDLEDFGQFCGAHRGEWESTTHYQILYGNQISLIIDKELPNDPNLLSESRIYLLEELTGIFWEVWEEEAKLYEAWEQYKKDNGHT